MKINRIPQYEIDCFNFRITEQSDGSQVIDRTLKTPTESLTYDMQQEYMEVHVQLAISDRMKKKAEREEVKRNKFSSKLLQKVACFCGIM